MVGIEGYLFRGYGDNHYRDRLTLLLNYLQLLPRFRVHPFRDIIPVYFRNQLYNIDDLSCRIRNLQVKRKRLSE